MTLGEVLAVAQYATQVGLSDQTLSDLRRRFCGIHLSHCQDDDIIDTLPYWQSPALNIYLVDGNNHCLSLTQDLERATGLLLAEVTDEEE